MLTGRPKKRLGICTIFRNEAEYLSEWISFHRAQGFSRFFLFDDISTDNFNEVLAPYIEDGLVVLSPAPTDISFGKRQRQVFELGLALARNECDWLALIDVDEFLFSPEGNVVGQLPANPLIAGVYVWERVFGTSGNLEPHESGVIRGNTMTSIFPKNRAETREILQLSREFFGGKRPGVHGALVQGKSIVRPKMIRKAGIHAPTKYWGILVTERGKVFVPRKSLIRWFQRRILRISDPIIAVPSVEKLRINHYWSKSLSELEAKASKWSGQVRPALREDYLWWDTMLNQVEDDTIVRLARPWE